MQAHYFKSNQEDSVNKADSQITTTNLSVNAA